MRAVALWKYLPIEHPESLVDVELPAPTPGPRDLRVQVKAIAVNPVDVKQRAPKDKVESAPRVLGWDVAGVVESVGAEVKRFQVGDEVFYAGSIVRPGCASELHLVDERIVGKKPKSLSFAQAAALPLTSLTAWELLFERLEVAREAPDVLLVVGAAGGVGSILVQLARKRTALTVVGTASRPQTVQWVKDLGAHHVIDHGLPLATQLKALFPQGARYAVGLTQTDRHFPDLAELMAPEGKLGLIDDPKQPLDVMLLKRKSVSLHWELMFTRSLYETKTLEQQGRILDEVSALVDQGVLRTTLNEDLGPISAANLKRAHALLETGHARGKLVLGGF